MEPDHSAASNTKSDGSMVLCCQEIICDNLSKLGEYLAQINQKKKKLFSKFGQDSLLPRVNLKSIHNQKVENYILFSGTSKPRKQ